MNVAMWLEAGGVILRELMGGPASQAEFLTGLVAGLIIHVVVQSAAGKALGLAQANRMTSSIVVVLGWVLILAGMVAARAYLPQWNVSGWRIWTLVASGVITSLVLVVPLICWLQRGGYLAALVAWVLSVLAASLVILFVGAVFDGVAAGARGAERGKQHKKQIERVLQ